MKNLFAGFGAVALAVAVLALALVLVRSSCTSYSEVYRTVSPDGKIYASISLRNSGAATSGYREVHIGRVDSHERLLVVGIRHCNNLEVQWIDDSTLEVEIGGSIVLDWLDDLFRDCFGLRNVNVRYVLN